MPETPSLAQKRPEIGYHQFKYTCPKCKRNSEISLQYIKDITYALEYEKKGFCSNRYCDASHHFKYRISLPRGSDWKDLKVKVSKFFVNNEEEKVQVLA